MLKATGQKVNPNSKLHRSVLGLYYRLFCEFRQVHLDSNLVGPFGWMDAADSQWKEQMSSGVRSRKQTRSVVGNLAQHLILLLMTMYGLLAAAA